MSSDALKTKIEFEKLKEFFSILPASAIGGFLAVLLVCVGLLDILPAVYLYVWLGFALFIFVSRVLLTWRFNVNKNQAESGIKFWRGLIIFNCFLSGASWGVASFIFYGNVSDIYQTYLLIAVLAVLSCYFPILVLYDKCYYAFALPAAVPLIYALSIANTAGAGYIAIIMTVYLCLMLVFARWFYSREFDRIRLRHTLYEQNEKVKEANDSKSRFLASASHDLRQPLQALGFYIVMLSDFLREPKKKALFDKTLRAYQALEDLLNQLLNISKLNANLVEVVNGDFSITELFAKLKNDYELQVHDEKVSLDFICDECYAYSDVVSVERIMRNLIENALRYTVKGRIEVSCHAEQDRLILKVSDTGIGISSEHVNKIFGEFYQIKNPERDRSKGFGLGLYAVDRLAKLLGVEINIRSELGKGSVFWLALPAGQKPKEVEPIGTDTIVRNMILRDKIVLVVDDDEVVLDSIFQLLLSWESQVLTATSYQQAMGLLNEEEIVPELLIMDYRLPNYETGVKLVKDIRLLVGIEIPAIILTGDTGEESLTEINNSGLPYLHKPTDPVKLKKMALQVLSD